MIQNKTIKLTEEKTMAASRKVAELKTPLLEKSIFVQKESFDVIVQKLNMAIHALNRGLELARPIRDDKEMVSYGDVRMLSELITDDIKKAADNCIKAMNTVRQAVNNLNANEREAKAKEINDATDKITNLDKDTTIVSFARTVDEYYTSFLKKYCSSTTSDLRHKIYDASESIHRTAESLTICCEALRKSNKEYAPPAAAAAAAAAALPESKAE